MAASILIDRVKILVQSSGVGAFGLGSAAAGFRGVEALVDGGIYSYAVESGSLYEVGQGVYNAGTTQFVRTPEISSNGNAAVSFPAGVELVFTARAADLIATGGSLPIANALGNDPNVAIGQQAATAAINGKASAAALAILDAAAVKHDINGHVGLGVAPASDAVLTIQTQDGFGLQRAAALNHYDSTAGSWALDVHVFQGGYGGIGGHCYSDRNGDPAGVVFAKFDHTRNGSILALSNARNQTTSPGTTGTADFLVLAGFPDTSVSLATNPIVLAQWQYQNIILTPQNAWPLTITGSGLVINALSTSPRGLLVNQGATGIYASIMSGEDYGLAVSTTLNGGQTATFTKNGTGNGSVVIIKNEGVDPSIIGFTGVTQGFAIYPNGDFYHGTTKVLGAQGAAVADAVPAAGVPTQAEFNALVTQFNLLLARVRSHGLIAT